MKLIIFFCLTSCFAFQFAFHHQSRSTLRMSSINDVHVMINGMPGPMATEVARQCINRGLKLCPVGFTGPDNDLKEISIDNRITINLEKGPGVSAVAEKRLLELKDSFPALLIVDYTHPSAVEHNVRAYTSANVDFVMGTTGFNQKVIDQILNQGKNYAVIAPNMAKQIVALQYTLQEAAKRFSGAFAGYKLSVRNSKNYDSDILNFVLIILI
jgi:4-hydroxy-tetrahydrodipicolinate reductase